MRTEPLLLINVDESVQSADDWFVRTGLEDLLPVIVPFPILARKRGGAHAAVAGDIEVLCEAMRPHVEELAEAFRSHLLEKVHIHGKIVVTHHEEDVCSGIAVTERKQ
jgi:hypothetical protein